LTIEALVDLDKAPATPDFAFGPFVVHTSNHNYIK